MEQSCKVPGCRNYYSSPGSICFKIPKEPLLIKKWLEFARRLDLLRTVSFDKFYVCTDHFKPSDFLTTSPTFKLNKNAIPSENPPPANVNIKSIIARPGRKSLKQKLEAAQRAVLVLQEPDSNKKQEGVLDHDYIVVQPTVQKEAASTGSYESVIDAVASGHFIAGVNSDESTVQVQAAVDTLQTQNENEESSENNESVTYFEASEEFLKELEESNIKLIDGQLMQIDENDPTAPPTVVELMYEQEEQPQNARTINPENRLRQLEEVCKRQRKTISQLRARNIRERKITQKIIDASKKGEPIPESRPEINRRKTYTDQAKQALLEIYNFNPEKYTRFSKLLGLPAKMVLRQWFPEKIPIGKIKKSESQESPKSNKRSRNKKGAEAVDYNYDFYNLNDDGSPNMVTYVTVKDQNGVIANNRGEPYQFQSF